MDLLKNLPFEPDEALRQFLEEYSRTNGRMFQNRNKAVMFDNEQHTGKPPIRPKYYGRKPNNSLAQIRVGQLMTQMQLAAWSGTTLRSIKRIENDSHYEPSVYLALALAQALDVTVETIFQLPHLTPVPPAKH